MPYSKYSKKWRDNRNRIANNKRIEWRRLVFNHYGSGCACCGESTQIFLTLDHIENNGNMHRLQISKGKSSRGGWPIYKWLVRNNFPPGYQILCFNCNYAKSKGECPHLSSNL